MCYLVMKTLALLLIFLLSVSLSGKWEIMAKQAFTTVWYLFLIVDMNFEILDFCPLFNIKILRITSIGQK